MDFILSDDGPAYRVRKSGSACGTKVETKDDTTGVMPLHGFFQSKLRVLRGAFAEKPDVRRLFFLDDPRHAMKKTSPFVSPF